MKFTTFVLIVSFLFVGIANLLVSLGFVGGSTCEYNVLSALQMKAWGFRKIAKQNGIKEGHWQFVSISSDDHYLFREKDEISNS